MTVTRFIAVKLKGEYAGDDEKSALSRQEIYQRHLALYKSRPYVSNVQGVQGGQGSPASHSYHYAFVVDFESEEKIKYYSDEDPDHLELKRQGADLFESLFVWGFPPRN